MQNSTTTPVNPLNNLAENRTILANERTLLAYIRTSIMLAISGVTLIKFFDHESFFLILGFALPPIALALVGFGFLRYKAMSRKISSLTLQTSGNTIETEASKTLPG